VSDVAELHSQPATLSNDAVQRIVVRALSSRFGSGAPTPSDGPDDATGVADRAGAATPNPRHASAAPARSRAASAASSAKSQNVVFAAAWLGRSSLHDYVAESAPVPSALNAMSVLGSLLARSFRMAFVPLWLHGHAHGTRVSRLDCSQHAILHGQSANHVITKLLDDDTALGVQRLALRMHTASTVSIECAAAALDVEEGALARIAAAKTADDALAAVCETSAIDGAKLVMFAKVTALKSCFLAFDLGDRTRGLQLAAIRKRFEIDDAVHDDDVLGAVPEHAHVLYWCLECSKKPNACVDAVARPISHNEVGVSQTMLRVGRIGCCNEVRCARRSSAALRTALQKESDAVEARIDGIEVTSASMQRAAIDNGDTAHAARLRRDVKACGEQLEHAMACGDRPLVRVSLLGRAIRVHNKFYALCSYCASVVHVSALRRYGGEICCCRCDAAMLGWEEVKSQAARVAPTAPTIMQRVPPRRLSALVAADQLTCRFCAKAPPTSGASRFRVFRAPLDNGGRNAQLPPPLRTVAFCPSHSRAWIEGALYTLPMSVIFAHVSEKAVPVFGAQSGRRAIALTVPTKAPPKSKAQRAIMKRYTSGGVTSQSRKRAR
jgi:hypothetical protein